MCTSVVCVRDAFLGASSTRDSRLTCVCTWGVLGDWVTKLAQKQNSSSLSECKALFVRARHECTMPAQLGLVFSESATLGHVQRNANGAQERALPASLGERSELGLFIGTFSSHI